MAGFTVTRRGPSEDRGASLSSGQVPNIPRVVNVQDPAYGAKGDGTTDDTAAIQAAINGLWNGGAGSGGIVYVPHTGSFYLLKSAVSFYPGIQLVGETTRNSPIRASTSGTYTNGPISAPYLFKYNGGDAWWHQGAFLNIGIDLQSAAGLGGIYFQAPGENSLIDCVRVDHAGSTPRTVTDVVTNATTTVTSATAAFTADDVNAVVTGTNIPPNTKIDIVVSATQVTLNNAASGSGSSGSLTVNRPADAITFDGTNGGAATGLIGSLNGSGNAGALVRIKNHVGPFWIESLSGDVNGGGLLRISHCSSNADLMTVTVAEIKGEADQTGGLTQMDPMVLLDNNDTVALNVLGGATAGASGGQLRDIVRLDQSVTTRGGPSVYLSSLEGTNPFNLGYNNLIHDTTSGKLFASTPMSGNFNSGRRFYPNVLWGRDLLIGGGGMIQRPTFAPTYGATVTPDASNGSWQTITVTNATAFTVAAPPNPPSANNTAELTVEVFNNSGGAMGAITWNTAFVFPTGAWVNPASTKRRFARFEWNGASWVCTSVATADY